MGTGANAITAAKLAALKKEWREGDPDRWRSDGGQRGAGRLVAKIGEHGVVTLYFVYFDSTGAKRFLLIGPWDSGSNGRGVTLQAARDRAAVLSMMKRNGTPDLHAHFEREREAEERAIRAAKEEARRAEELAQRGSLRELLENYVAHLEGEGKQCAKDVRWIFRRHVYEAAPDMAARRASEIPSEDFVGLLRKLVKAKHGRTAAKLRSFLRAAFGLAIKSEMDPAAPSSLPSSGINTNPIAAIASMAQFNRPRDRNLDAKELSAFLKRLEGVPASTKKDGITLCLLLGGQRPAQLLRARPIDVDLSAGTLTLYDPKGKRTEPRAHVLPLTDKTAAIVRRLLDDLPEKAQYIFTSDGGKTPLRPETASAVVAEISTAMIEAKEAREGFELRDLRRTSETGFAALGVSSDLRAQLLSHGLGGVQNRNYNKHKYAAEKRAALELWQQHLERLERVAAGETAEIIPMREKQA